MNDKSELLQKLKIDRSTSPAKSGIKLWQVIILLLISIVITIWLTRRISPVPQEPVPGITTLESEGSSSVFRNRTEQTPELKTQQLIDAENNVILNSSGYITARQIATVSAEIMGLITEVNVEEGMSVEKGQILARLDDALATANYDYASAQIAVLSARRKAISVNLEEAKRSYQRVVKNIYSSDAERSGSLAMEQSLLANLESADADIQVAKIEVRRQQERLDDHSIRAPFSGVVITKNAQAGEIVSPSSAGGGFTRTGICTIVDMNSLEIEVDVNESFIGRVYPGQRVEANLDAYPDWDIPASVIATIPTADRAKATVQVRIKIEINDPRILPDMGVKVGFLKE
ncbi:MAG: HlyD family secretion protein [Paraglaciecola sp.]